MMSPTVFAFSRGSPGDQTVAAGFTACWPRGLLDSHVGVHRLAVLGLVMKVFALARMNKRKDERVRVMADLTEGN